VYQANLGSQTLTANGATCDSGGPGPGVVSGCNPLLTISALPPNSYIVAFLELGTPAGSNCGQSQCNIATALSGALLVPGPVLGAGLPGLVAACVGLAGLARRRRKKIA